MLLADFRFVDNFVNIPDSEMQLALDEAEVAWAGIRTLWGKLAEPLKTNKRDLCMNYVCAWYLADMHPKSVTGGVFSTGGTPLDSKSIDGISVHYKQRPVPKGMEAFQSNIFGLKALDMILNAPDMLLIHG